MKLIEASKRLRSGAQEVEGSFFFRKGAASAAPSRAKNESGFSR